MAKKRQPTKKTTTKTKLRTTRLQEPIFWRQVGLAMARRLCGNELTPASNNLWLSPSNINPNDIAEEERSTYIGKVVRRYDCEPYRLKAQEYADLSQTWNCALWEGSLAATTLRLIINQFTNTSTISWPGSPHFYIVDIQKRNAWREYARSRGAEF